LIFVLGRSLALRKVAKVVIAEGEHVADDVAKELENHAAALRAP
jgi:hypothetical protein